MCFSCWRSRSADLVNDGKNDDACTREGRRTGRSGNSWTTLLFRTSSQWREAAGMGFTVAVTFWVNASRVLAPSFSFFTPEKEGNRNKKKQEKKKREKK